MGVAIFLGRERIMSQTDAMLFENWLRERDANAFKTLATRYAGMVYETCRRILNNSSEAEDVTQECFVILATTNKPVGGYLAPWLHRVAYNRSLARLRSEHRRREREIRFADQQPIARDMAWDEIGAYVDEAIAELPEKLRVPVVAYFLDGKTHEAVAQTLGIPRSTVTYRVDKGVEALRKTLKSKGVAVTGVAAAGVMKGSAAAVPASVFANLGKLALSAPGHVAVPATVAAAPLAKTVFGAWTAKTLCATAAGVAIALFAGWEIHRAAVTHDAQTQRASRPSTTSTASNIPAGSPNKIAEPPIAVAAVPVSSDNPEDRASQYPPEDPVAYTNMDEPMVVAQGEPGILNRISDRVSNAWQSIRMTFSEDARREARRSACAMNLKQMGLTFKMFANESPGQYFPMLNPRAGHLMFANDNPGMESVYPEYFVDISVLVCPDDSLPAPLLQKTGLDLLDYCSYFYLGYVVHSIEDLEAFADAYRDRIAKGLPFDTDLDIPSGKLYRLREGVEQFFITDPDNPAATAMAQSQIPILIEAPDHHDPEGGMVLFMDGHVEFIRYSPNGPFPMNKAAMDILKSLSAMKGATPPM